VLKDEGHRQSPSAECCSGFVGAMLLILGQGKSIGFGSSAILILVAAVAFQPLLHPPEATAGEVQPAPGGEYRGVDRDRADIRRRSTSARRSRRPRRARSWCWPLLGVLPGALAYVSWSFVLSKIPASKAAASSTASHR